MKTIQLSVIAISIASALNVNQAEANSSSDIETITVTATRSEQSQDMALSSQVVITQEEIEAIQPKSILDLLKSVAGIDMSQQGGRGQAATVFMRGTNSNHSLILLDGVRISSATLGIANIQSISPSQIERIEIIKGPRAAIWGSDAIGGVIQLFSKHHQGLQATAVVGAQGYRQASASVGFAHGEGYSSISINKEQADGFDVLQSAEPDDDGFEHTSVSLTGMQPLSEKISVDYLLQANQGESDYDNAWFGNNQTQSNNHAWFIRGHYQTSESNTTQIKVAQNRDSEFSFGDNPDYDPDTLFETRRDQISVVNHNKASEELEFNLGLDFSHESIKSSTEFEQDSRNIVAVFGHGHYQFGKGNVELAVRYDNVDEIDSEVTVNSGLGYQVTDDIRMVINYGTGFKTPTFNDLYYPTDPYSKGNPNLKAETSNTSELLWQYKTQQLQIGSSVYQTNVENLIEWQVNENFVYQPQNVAEVDIQGIELESRFEHSWGQHQVTFSYIKSEDASTGDQLIRRAKQHMNYRFSKAIGQSELSLEYSYKGKRFDRYYDPETFSTKQTELKAFSLINVSVSTGLTEKIKLNMKVSNLLDKQYQTTYGYNSQGQVWYLGVSYTN